MTHGWKVLFHVDPRSFVNYVFPMSEEACPYLEGIRAGKTWVLMTLLNGISSVRSSVPDNYEASAILVDHAWNLALEPL